MLRHLAVSTGYRIGVAIEARASIERRPKLRQDCIFFELSPIGIMLDLRSEAVGERIGFDFSWQGRNWIG